MIVLGHPESEQQKKESRETRSRITLLARVARGFLFRQSRVAFVDLRRPGTIKAVSPARLMGYGRMESLHVIVEHTASCQPEKRFVGSRRKYRL